MDDDPVKAMIKFNRARIYKLTSKTLFPFIQAQLLRPSLTIKLAQKLAYFYYLPICRFIDRLLASIKKPAPSWAGLCIINWRLDRNRGFNALVGVVVFQLDIVHVKVKDGGLVGI